MIQVREDVWGLWPSTSRPAYPRTLAVGITENKNTAETVIKGANE